MALAKPILSDDSSVLLRFGGVEVDAARHRLVVDGREMRVQRLVFNLLLALCEAHGRVLSRDELFSKLWPDGTFPADESLSQLVFKLRAALGPYGSSIVTVRQVGVRLDADVERIAVPPAAARSLMPDEPDDVAGAPRAAVNEPYVEDAARVPTAPTRAPSRPGRRVVVAAAVLLALTIAASVFAPHWRSPVVVSAGFGLDSDDVQASDARSIEALQRAFDADADGNQAAARVLMETVHATDSRTPVPAMFLTYWYGGVGEAAVADRWAAERDRRLRPDTPTYVVLLARYLSKRDAPELERLKLESLLLESKPGAALIRIARAHHHLQRNERGAALLHLRQVDLRAAGRRRAPIVLGDLAALGDLDAVTEAIDASGDVLDAPGRAYVEARVRSSQGRYREARASFDRVMAFANTAERPDLMRGAALHAAMLSAELGEFDDARRRLERSIQALRDERAYVYAWNSTLVLAALPNLDEKEARRLLEELAADMRSSARSDFCLELELVAALIRLDAAPSLRCDTSRADTHARRGGYVLADGLRAQLAGDSAGARAALARAQSEGVRDTVLAPYADLLAARLDASLVNTPVPDPPYPASHRWALRWREAAAQAGGDPTRKLP
jgi:DNA-binding winged helix-turn-helix (wHTH) protein/tetratricopeptide (TPR) repeat protein